jgi:two-component system, NtrC family, sensor histidine kinase KinB
MLGIRQKLMLGFGGLFVVVAAAGMLTITQTDRLGRAIDVILTENYRSVVACQDMKESLELLDTGVLLCLAGGEADGDSLISENVSRFRVAMDLERSNITLPGEQDLVERIGDLFEQCLLILPTSGQTSGSLEVRRAEYFSRLRPLFQETKAAVQEVLRMNQTNMSEANNAALGVADSVHRGLLVLIIVSAAIMLLYSQLVRRWILRPIHRLMASVDEIRQGNYDVVLKTGSHDEIGRLSDSFCEMTAGLRQVRKEDRLSLMRTRRATEEVFKALPVAIAVLDLDGKVEMATETAGKAFGLRPGANPGDLGFDWLPAMMRTALDEDRIISHRSGNGSFQHFVDNRERFYQPTVVPIAIGDGNREPAGVALILEDVSQVHEQKELKRGVVATVSHQLRTPLTSIRMSIHLLLDDRIGSLSDTQSGLLIAARDDSERLVSILDDLLDLDRIESGGNNLRFEPVSPQTLVRNAIEPVLPEARDRRLRIDSVVPDDLPEVRADIGRIQHVFANLLSNAIRYTSPGGILTLRADPGLDCVIFTVEDTGIGIPPDCLDHLFEPFFRVHGQDGRTGAGLGLTISREIVLAHGGEISVKSTMGVGSCFRFTLPTVDRNSSQIPSKKDGRCS